MKCAVSPFLALVLLSGCATAPSEPAQSPSPAGSPSPTSKGDRAALPNSGIRFFEDDYEAALAEAKRRKKPLFVDEWATWCHTCLSMRSYVFPSAELAPLADAFVWLAIDTEKESNRAAVEKLPIAAWPTLWVVDPENGKVGLQWAGAATPSELVTLLEDAVASLKGTPSSEAAAAFVRGQKAGAAGHRAEAIAEYRKSLENAPAGWARTGRVVEALTYQLSASRDAGACVEVASQYLPAMDAGTSLAVVATTALDCCHILDRKDPRRRPAVDNLLARGEAIAGDPRQPILADDRSALYEALVNLLKAEKRGAEAARLAGEWSAYLDGEAKRAATKEARAVFDAHRALAYDAMGKPELAIPMLEQSEKDFPGDYNPPARLARVYKSQGKIDLALSTLDRALAKVYGPRELSLRTFQLALLEEKKDTAGAIAALETTLAHTANMPLPPRLKETRDHLAEVLETKKRARDNGAKTEDRKATK